MPKTKAEKAADKLCELSLEKKKEQANVAATIHKILDGRWMPEHVAKERESRGKFFGQ